MEAGVVVHQLINVMLIKEIVILMLIVKLGSSVEQTTVKYHQRTIMMVTLIVVTKDKLDQVDLFSTLSIRIGFHWFMLIRLK